MSELLIEIVEEVLVDKRIKKELEFDEIMDFIIDNMEMSFKGNSREEIITNVIEEINKL